jgi:protoporphyrinogen oxidase
VSTMALTALVRITDGLSTEAQRAGESLVHSSTHVFGVGLRGERPPEVGRKCWMYFPESNSPYYRVTVFSNYSPRNAPEGCWSLMAEVAESPVKPVDATAVFDEVIRALREDGLIGAATEVVSRWHHREEFGYPTPFLGRDEVLAAIQPELEGRRIFSRGRFGAWKYEVSNQDHSFMQGVELVDRLLGEGDEPTLNRPDYANSGVFLKA